MSAGENQLAPPGSARRPIAALQFFLEDVKARGFFPRGVIDVGAHKGNWTRGVLVTFPGTRVIMIEPLDEMTGSRAISEQ